MLTQGKSMETKLGTEGKYALQTTNKSQGMVMRQGRSELGSAYGYGGPPCVVCMMHRALFPAHQFAKRVDRPA